MKSSVYGFVSEGYNERVFLRLVRGLYFKDLPSSISSRIVFDDWECRTPDGSSLSVMVERCKSWISRWTAYYIHTGFAEKLNVYLLIDSSSTCWDTNQILLSSLKKKGVKIVESSPVSLEWMIINILCVNNLYHPKGDWKNKSEKDLKKMKYKDQTIVSYLSDDREIMRLWLQKEYLEVARKVIPELNEILTTYDDIIQSEWISS